MIVESLQTVFRRPGYAVAALVISIVVFVGGVLIPHYQLLQTVLGNQTLSLFEKTTFIISLLGAIETNFMFVSASVLLVSSLLFGINVVMLVYHIRRVRGEGVAAMGATSVGGFVSAIFGIGCAACGSLIATSVLATLGAGGLITLLPLRGVEFGFIGIALLLYSIWLIGKKINAPLVCDMS